MTNRSTSHDHEAKAEKPAAPDFSKYKVCDSYCNPITDTTAPGGGATEKHRLSHRRLEELEVF